MTKRAPSVASNYDPELFVQFLNDFGQQYANSYRSACNAEHHYMTGKLPPHYPVPALPLDVGPTMCRGLLGTCVYCIWPVCEYKT